MKGEFMVSKETLILISVLIVLVVGFMAWSNDTSKSIEQSVDEQIEQVLDP
jgi:sensor domain CHASE-containing protein